MAKRHCVRNPYMRRVFVAIPMELWVYITEQAAELQVTKSRWITNLILTHLGDKAPRCERYKQYVAENPKLTGTQSWSRQRHNDRVERIKNLISLQKEMSRSKVGQILSVSTKTASQIMRDVTMFHPDNAKIVYRGRGGKMYLQWKD